MMNCPSLIFALWALNFPVRSNRARAPAEVSFVQVGHSGPDAANRWEKIKAALATRACP